jgi:hypothetical protein
LKLPVEWLAPAGLGLAALLAPLVALYLLKVRRQRRQVGSTWLWQAARRDLMARSPFQRLIVQVPLVLEALALCALALGAARPASRGTELTGEHVAVIVDTSASMSATDPRTGQRRIELAKAAARELVLGLRPGSDALLLDAGRDARIALPPDRDTRRLRAAIDGLDARDVEGDLGAAIALAASRLKQLGGERSIVVLSDGNLPRPAALSDAAIPIELVRVGEPADNVAIVRLDVRTGTDPVLGREQVQGFLLLSNHGQAARELFVTMRERNASDVLDSRRVTIAPGASEPVVLSFNPAPGDYGQGLLFELSPHDALPADDVAYGRVPMGRRLPVIVAAAGAPSPWLLRALAADPNVEVRTLALGELSGALGIDAGTFVVLEGACPAATPGGDLLLVNPPPGECHGALVGESIEHPLITSWDRARGCASFRSTESASPARGRSGRKADGRSSSAPIAVSSPPTSRRARAPPPCSASTWARATGRSRPRSCSSCAT